LGDRQLNTLVPGIQFENKILVRKKLNTLEGIQGDKKNGWNRKLNTLGGIQFKKKMDGIGN